MGLAAALLGAWLCTATGAGGPEAAPDLEVFTREGCPHCEAARAFLDGLERERPWLRVRYLDVVRDREALARLQALAAAAGDAPAVPSFLVRGRLIVGFREEATGPLLRALLAGSAPPPAGAPAYGPAAPCPPAPDAEEVRVPLLGHLSARRLGLPAFTVAIGLLDGFNPCAMWVLLFLLSLLVNLRSRARMVAVAGTFVAVSGLFYFLFMAAWLNVFLLVGLSRTAQVALGLLALAVGAVDVKDFLAFGKGPSLSIPEAAKPGIYARTRRILQAPTPWQAVGGAAVLAMLVNTVEALCTAGLPVAYTSVLALHHLPRWQHYGYLALYNVAYVADDTLMLAVATITLSQAKLQEKGGRALKLVAGLAMLVLGAVLIFAPGWVAF